MNRAKFIVERMEGPSTSWLKSSFHFTRPRSSTCPRFVTRVSIFDARKQNPTPWKIEERREGRRRARLLGKGGRGGRFSPRNERIPLIRSVLRQMNSTPVDKALPPPSPPPLSLSLARPSSSSSLFAPSALLPPPPFVLVSVPLSGKRSFIFSRCPPFFSS